MKLLEKIAEFYRRRGRKALRLSTWFDVFVERYYPLGYGMPRDDGTFDRRAAWPNVFIHCFAEQLDEFAHDHGRWAVSVIMSGGYEEWRPRWKRWRTRRPGNVTFQAYDEPHLIKNLEPDTWTLFAVGPFVRPYLIYRPDQVVSREEMVENGERALTSLLPETPALLRKMEFRQRAKARFLAKKKTLTQLLPASPSVLEKVAARAEQRFT